MFRLRGIQRKRERWWRCVRDRTDRKRQWEASFGMDWNTAAHDWTHFKCEVRSRWSRLSELQLDRISGRRTRLAGELRQSYEWTAEQAERQICWFELLNVTPRAVSSR
jgi:hypothetical protein